MAELKRLREILGSAMYGRAQYTRRGVRMLLPAGRDAFSVALGRLVAADWNVPTLLEAAREAALTYDDISLVGLAARVGDPVALAALRDSAVLQAEKRLTPRQPSNSPAHRLNRQCCLTPPGDPASVGAPKPVLANQRERAGGARDVRFRTRRRSHHGRRCRHRFRHRTGLP